MGSASPVVFAQDATITNISISITNDEVHEGLESFLVQLQATGTTQVTAPTATVTITDNDCE